MIDWGVVQSGIQDPMAQEPNNPSKSFPFRAEKQAIGVEKHVPEAKSQEQKTRVISGDEKPSRKEIYSERRDDADPDRIASLRKEMREIGSSIANSLNS